MSGRASGSCRCSTRCWARYQPLERRPWSSPTGCPPAKWCLNWLQSQLFRQILSPFFMPKNDGIPMTLPISRCFSNVPSFQPQPGAEKAAASFAGLPKPTGARLGGLCTAWEGASGQTQGSLWGLPRNRRAAQPRGWVHWRFRFDFTKLGAVGSSWCLKEWKNCLFFVGWMLGEHGNTW